MLLARRHALRRRLAVLVLGVVAVIAAEVSLPVSSLAPGTATAVADSGSAYDRSLRAGECALLGRAYATGLGCARDRCVEGAVLWRKVAGAEACALVGQPKGFGFAATVDVRQCQDLHRRWIAAVNYCASQPDRSLAAVRDAPQCASPASIYVTLSETEGRYDECLTTARVAALSRQAAAHGTTLAAEVAARQRLAEPRSGGMLMVGDSVSWRGNDELARLRPELTVDAEPARRPTELADRLDAFRAKHGQLAGLIVELGTNPAPGFGRRDLADAVRSLPIGTPGHARAALRRGEQRPGGRVVVVAAVRRLDALRRRRPSAHLCRGLAGVRAVAPRPAPGRHPPAERRRVRLGPLDRRPVGAVLLLTHAGGTGSCRPRACSRSSAGGRSSRRPAGDCRDWCSGLGTRRTPDRERRDAARRSRRHLAELPST